jgi:hypothetical protein
VKKTRSATQARSNLKFKHNMTRLTLYNCTLWETSDRSFFQFHKHPKCYQILNVLECKNTSSQLRNKGPGLLYIGMKWRGFPIEINLENQKGILHRVLFRSFHDFVLSQSYQPVIYLYLAWRWSSMENDQQILMCSQL